MQISDSKHEDVRSIDPVEHAVGEPARDSSPNFSMDDLVLHRVEADAIEEGVDLLHEHAAEANALGFIPSGGPSDVRLGLPPDDQAVGSQITENVVPCRLPALNIGRALVMLSDALVQQAPVGLTQRSLLKILRNLVPELLHEPSPLGDRKASEGLNDLLGIHLHLTLQRDGTADWR